MNESPDLEIQFCLNRDDDGHGDVIDDDQYQCDEHVSSQNHSDEEETKYTEQNKNHSHYTRREANNAGTIPIRLFPNYGPSLKPELFNGKECWEEYISHFENCAELCNWTKRDKVLFLAASLRGQARTYYMSLENEEKRSYDILVARLSQRFGSSRHQNRWLARLEMRKRQPSEPIAALGDDIRQMAQKAFCNLDSKAQESLALNQFCKILPTEMKCRCIDNNCETVADAVDVVERYEAILGDEYDKKKANVRAVGSNKTEHQGSNDNGRIGAMLQRIEKRLELLEKGSTPLKNVKDWINQIQNRYAPRNEKRRTCFVCNSPDHFFRNCPTFIQCKSCTAPGHDDRKDKASSQGKESSSSTYNQGNDKPTGHIGEISSQWDNGFYTNGMIDGTKFIFLIDSGSTASLLSYSTYQKLYGENKYMLTPFETKVNDVNGNEIHTYGSINVATNFSGISFSQKVIVCDVSQDGILGQDFLLNHVNKINYKQFLLHTEKIDIRC
ncbi:hypothetical protein CHS0354_017923 [Potamilus streckersoni]|uniref:CCHC-type domain-containing protein n=1 Tax=Potamilus streckersoni TaxID=2493646 RepID=A0AAE0RW51_9BIVA|nr:hypothetical protein CHS0354_017923 [Potamilus streckersoni]